MSVGDDVSTASSSVAAVKTLEARVRDLLTKASQVKQTTAIDPPLHAADFDNDIRSLGPSPSDSSSPTASSQTLLETAVRNVFYPLITKLDISTPAFVAVWNLFDLLNICADASLCDPSLSLWLVEELLDSQTIHGCRRVFDYLEARRERLIPVNSASEGDDGKGVVTKDPVIRNRLMIVLRSCNELLRRLSRAEDAVFCGRVFIFLFQSFPLGDKSSVNLRGEFHVENVTVFDDTSAKDEAEGHDEMEVDADKGGVQAEVTESTGTPVAKPADDAVKDSKAAAEDKTDADEVDINALYSIFWSLQHVFSNPTKVFAREEFEAFKTGLAVTIKKFKTVPKVLQTHGTPRTAADGQKGTKRKRVREGDDFASNFNPKYLTSRDLFELELSDLTFQRHILVQSLILIDFLLSLTPKAKKNLTDLKAQKSLVYNYTLNDADTKWATETRSAIALYLQEGPDGKFYYRMADTVLARDKNWVRWKAEVCPPISMPPVSTADQTGAMAGAKRSFANRRIKANPMGAVDMSFVSDTVNVNPLEKLRNAEAVKVPDAERCVRDVEHVDLDLEMATGEEETYLKEGRTTAVWRALRVAARRRFVVLDKLDEGPKLSNLLKDDSTLSAAETKKVVSKDSGDVKIDDGDTQMIESEATQMQSTTDAETAGKLREESTMEETPSAVDENGTNGEGQEETAAPSVTAQAADDEPAPEDVKPAEP